jgi:hypothetical protein
MTTSPQSESSTSAPAAPNTTVPSAAAPSTATPSTPAVQEPKRRRGRAPAAPSNTYAFYDGAVSADGTIASIGKRFETEIDAQKASVRSGKPYLKIETLRVEFVVTDGKLVAVATPAKK